MKYFFAFFNASAKPKIDNFRRQLFSKDHILQLNVSVRNLSLMKVLQGFSKRSNDGLAMILRSSMVGLILEVVVKRYPIKIFHDDVEVVVCFHYIQYLHNIRVA